MKAEFGWTVVQQGGSGGKYIVYKRDCLEYLAIPVFPTRKIAEAYAKERRNCPSCKGGGGWERCDECNRARAEAIKEFPFTAYK